MGKIENTELLKDLMEIAVADYYLYEPESGLELYSGTLESHELAKTVDTEDIKGGQRNDTIATITKSTDISLKVVDVCARQDVQALKLGGKITKVEASDNVLAMHMPENIEVKKVDTEKVVTLPQAPHDGEEVVLYNNNTKKMLVKDTDYTYAPETDAKKIVINAEDIKEGDTVFVTGYLYKTPEGTRYFDIKEGSIPTMAAVIELPIFVGDNVVAYKQYYFPKAQMDSAVTLSGSTEKTKSTDETNIKILKDRSKNYLGRVIYREVTE